MNLTGTILVANSDRITTEFFDIVLSKLKFDVIKAFSGPDVLSKVKKYPVDLLLIDNNLPKYNGIKVTKKIRKSKEFKGCRHLPIIIFSSENNPKEKVLGFESGVDDFITTPYNFCEVLARIRMILRHKILMNQIVKKESRLAVLESLNANLISFTRHVRKPLASLHKSLNKMDCSSKSSVSDFIKEFKGNYKEMNAMLDTLEEEIEIFQNGKMTFKKDEFSIEEIEKKIDKRLKLG
jgi:DNA-binding response OmpR family regulator